MNAARWRDPGSRRGALLRVVLFFVLYSALELLLGFAVYGVFAAAMRERVVSRPAVMAWMRRTFAAAFVMLGARLALTER